MKSEKLDDATPYINIVDGYSTIVDIKKTTEVLRLLKYINEQVKLSKNHAAPFLIEIPLYGELGELLGSDEVHKLLIFLYRKKVIDKLNLPLKFLTKDGHIARMDFKYNLYPDEVSYRKALEEGRWHSKDASFKVINLRNFQRIKHNIIYSSGDLVPTESLLDVKKFIPPVFDLQKNARMDFDSQNGVIRCGDIKPYSFHRGAKGDKPLLRLFRKLWDERRHFLKGKERKKGESFSSEALMSQIDVKKEKLISMLKSISRMLKTRKFPARIERKNGILLIVTEK